MKTTKIILLSLLLTLVCSCSKQPSNDTATSVESLLIQAQQTIKEQEAMIALLKADIALRDKEIEMLKENKGGE